MCDSFSINIEPVFYKKMNSNVRRITGITEGALRGCLHFDGAFGKFLDFCGSEFCFMTWGRDDIPMLKDNLRAHGINCALPKSYDLQLIFNHQVTHSSPSVVTVGCQWKFWRLSSGIRRTMHFLMR